MERVIPFRHKKLIICLFLIVVTLIAYWGTMNNGFVDYDDQFYITQNQHVKNGITYEGIIWAFTNTRTGYLHPLTWLSYMFDYELYGLNPMGYHWTNLQFHIANTVLLFLVINLMTSTLWRSALVAALFALHPLHVESVAWIAERKDVLSAFFFILSIWAYVRYTQSPGRKKYFIIVLFFVLSLMSKPMAVTLPFVLLLLDYWPLERILFCNSFNPKIIYPYNFSKLPFPRLILEKIPLFIITAIASLFTVYMQQLAVGPVINIKSFSIKLRIYNALSSYAIYMEKMFWPGHLAVYYPYPKMFNLWLVFASGFFLLCVSLFVVMVSRKFSYMVTGWLWYLGTLVPVIGLISAGSHSMADRYTYIPLIGMFIVVVWGISDFSKKWRHKKIILSTIAGVVLVSLTICTWFQVRYWKNSKLLFTHAVEVTHNNWLAHKVLGLVYKKEGKLEKAVAQFNEILKINPENVGAHINLGNIFILEGKAKNAMDHFHTALEINPENPGAHNDLGNALALQGKAKEAIYHYYKTLQINPEYIEAYLNLGKLFNSQGKIKKAIHNYQRALSIDSYAIRGLYNLSWIYATCDIEKFRNGKQSVLLAEKLCKITRYKQPLALDVLAAAYAETGRFEKAVLISKRGLNFALLYGQKEMISGLTKRLKLYQAGRPYRQGLSSED